MLKNQLFGVEVEMTGITREKAWNNTFSSRIKLLPHTHDC